MSPRLPDSGILLELACGTLQHACHIAPDHPGMVWQPTDIDADVLAYGAAIERPENVPEPLYLDVLSESWPVAQADVIFAVNLLHVSPPSLPAAIFGGARCLGALDVFIYGPFFVQGQVASPGNVQFDEELRRQHPQWGIRAINDVQAAAATAGYQLVDALPMPSNNLLLHLRRTSRP